MDDYMIDTNISENSPASPKKSRINSGKKSKRTLSANQSSTTKGN
jgi:plasmid rolling circle replication initiator protein Rep